MKMEKTIKGVAAYARAHGACALGKNYVEKFESYDSLIQDGAEKFISWIALNMPELFADIKKRHSDENGNLFCENCVDCVDCTLCENCYDCTNCIDCVDCTLCKYCVGCEACEGLTKNKPTRKARAMKSR
jgi:hypothetical protein